MKSLKQEQHTISLIYTTVGSKDEAEALAYQAVNEGVAACVNILSKGVSIYKWENKVENSEEYYLLFKTCVANAPTLKKWLAQQHPYDCPAILHFDAGCSEKFFEFVENSMTKNVILDLK